MRKIFTAQLSWLCLVLLLGFASSCEKDTDTNSGKAELLSYGPAGVKHGEKISFIGKNLNSVTAVEFTGASVDKSAFAEHTSELIVVTVPAAAERGVVTLKTPAGDITSKAPIDFDVPFTITSVPASAKPGSNITIKGQFLNWITGVKFAADTTVTEFVSKTASELVVTVPINAQTGPLVFLGAGTEPHTLEMDVPLVLTLPMITALAPNPVKHAANLTITGTNLDLVQGVIFTGVTAAQTSFISRSASQIVVKVPAGTKTGKVTLAAYSTITTESPAELMVVLPVITALSPNPADPAANITITGTNLDLVKSITFTGKDPVTSFVSKTASQIVVKVPAGALKGKLILAVENSTLTVESVQILDFLGGLPNLADFPYPIYTDALQNAFQDWSYTDLHDFNSTANVRQGTKSVKAVYGLGGYQAVTFHPAAAVPAGAYTKLEFSVFGEAGTGDKKINIIINGNYTNPPQVTVKAGEWTTYTVTMSALGNPNTLTEIALQSAGWAGTVHIDHVGLR